MKAGVNDGWGIMAVIIGVLRSWDLARYSIRHVTSALLNPTFPRFGLGNKRDPQMFDLFHSVGIIR